MESLVAMRRWRRKTVVILGSSQSGKTSLFKRLTGQTMQSVVPSLSPEKAVIKPYWIESMRIKEYTMRPWNTVESIEYHQGEAHCILNGDMTVFGKGWGTTVQLVDLPGDPYLMDFMDDPLRKADVVIFLIDGEKFLDHLHDTATKLWRVLGDPANDKNRGVPTIMAINKWDLGSKVHSQKFIVRRLQHEIEHIRTNGAQLEPAQKPFRFEDLKVHVGVASVSVKMDTFEPISIFLERHLNFNPEAY